MVVTRPREAISRSSPRARHQLRLKQTVEGLSVAAISYYVMGLISYVLDCCIFSAGTCPRRLSGWLFQSSSL